MVSNMSKRIIIVILSFLFFNANVDAQKAFPKENLELAAEAAKSMDFRKALSYISPIEDNFDEYDQETQINAAQIIGLCHEQTGDYAKAALIYEKVLTITPKASIPFYLAKLHLFSVYFTLQDEKLSIVLAEIEEIFKRSDFKESGLYSDYAVALCSYYVNCGRYQDALYAASEGLSVIDKESDENLKGIQKHTLFINLGSSYRELGNYIQAAEEFKKALGYISFSQNLKLSEALTGIGICYDYANMPDSAIVYFEAAEKIYQKTGGPITNIRVNNSLSYGVNLTFIGECQKAQKYLKDAELGFEKLGNKKMLAYVYALLYSNSSSIGDIDQTHKYADLVKQNVKHARGLVDKISLACYSAYVSILRSEGKLDEALAKMKQIIADGTKIEGNRSRNSSMDFYQLALLYQDTRDYIEAERAIREAISLIEPIKSENKGIYISYCVLQADILSKTNRIGEALKNLENIDTFVAESQSFNLAVSDYYDILSSLYAELGNNDLILKYSLMASELKMRTHGKESYAYAVSLINLSETYRLLERFDLADQSVNVASDIIIKLYGKSSKEYYDVAYKRAIHYTFDTSRMEDGEKAFSDCLNLSEKLFGKNSTQYAEVMAWYGIFRFYTAKDDKGLKELQKGVDILISIEGYEGRILFFLSMLSSGYHIAKDYESAYYADRQYYSKVRSYVSMNLPNMVDWQRDALWTPIEENISNLISAASETHSSQYRKLAYNSLLLGKGLLLQSNNNISSAVRQSDDNELIDISNRIQLEKKKLLTLESPDETKELRGDINRLQRMVLNRLNSADVLQDIINVEWADVSDALEKDAIAIEFYSYQTQDCMSYVALIVQANSLEPQILPLFNDKELERFILDENMGYDYQNPGLYKVIWNILESYALKNIKTVYFSPHGLLHKIAIENLVDQNGVYASEKWNLHRLTSTREIIRRKSINKYSSAALFGGLKYNMTEETLEELSRNRAGVKTLAETRNEVIRISEILQEASVVCQTKMDEAGTEEALMSLSSTGVNLLHLATHGFFWTEKDRQEYRNLPYLALIEGNDKKESALFRSGVLLSGANLALQGKLGSQNIEDGVLTAHEISTLDFGDLDLVVLSACQTALGETSGDGVFGLQRGFKLAGAQSLLMSLWKVDDSATRLLMTLFYKELLKGKSKTEALQIAQKSVRNQEGFESPVYWAGFILLDDASPDHF